MQIISCRYSINMNLKSSYLFLTICLFAQITNEEMTTAKTPTVRETGESNLKETTEYKDETKKSTTVQGKINVQDFKVTKLKSHHQVDENTEDCLANLDPQKVEAVKKSIRNHDGKIEYVPADPLHVSDEDIKIVNCLKKEVAENKMTLTTKYETVEKNIEANNENVTNSNSDNSKANLNRIQEAMNDTRRRDTEYQFAALDYYDDELVFDNTTCPDKVEVIELELSEVRKYDLECQLITYWTGLADASIMYYNS